MDFRVSYGETITGESWLMRDLWQTSNMQYGFDVATNPKRLKSSAIKRLIERALWAQGIRTKVEKNRKRHKFQADHVLRKWFKTRSEMARMRFFIVVAYHFKIDILKNMKTNLQSEC